MIGDAGWYLARTRGSHRQYGTAMNQQRYVVVIEGAPGA
jgi:predicted RNA binding protein YcfA (HicA-like mRNA interferase family)